MISDFPTTPQIESVFQKAQGLAITLERNGVDLDLFFHCFIQDLSLSCETILNKYDCIDALRLSSTTVLERKRPNKVVSSKYTSKLNQFMDNCKVVQTELFELDYITPEVLLLNFFNEDCVPKALLEVLDVDDMSNLISDITKFSKDEGFEFDGDEDGLDDLDLSRSVDWVDMFDENPILDQFAENLNAKAAKNEFDKIVDFDDKISEIATILCRKKKPNAILVGPAGTGKTSLVEGLAAQIVNGDAPELIANKVIYSLSLSSMVAGTQYRGQFEERLEKFVNEVKKYDNIILFIDEIHTLVGAGGTTENSLEASNILKPELARGTISCIGATTINEYTNTIKKDTALDRRFERVIIKEPSKFQMKEIIPTITSYYEDFHGVEYSDNFVSNVLDYCEKFLPNKFYPDKAIDVIDHCGAQSKLSYWEIDPSIKDLQDEILIGASKKSTKDLISLMSEKLMEWGEDMQKNSPSVTIQHLKDFFSKKENPLCKLDIRLDLSEGLKSNFVGHNGVIDELMESVSLSNYGMNKKGSAPNIYCITGAESTGKTLFCSVLKDNLEKNGVNVLKYSGVHFSDEYAKFKISPETNNNTSLCEKVNIHPNSVIIIDDFHKVHVSVKTIFAQILKEGKIQMSNGDIADFSNSKIFVTSGVQNDNSMGFNSSSETTVSSVFQELTSLFDCNVFLRSLRKKDIFRVLWYKLNKINSDLQINDIEVVFSLKFLKKFAKESKSLIDFEKRFEEQINKFICQKITLNESKINLDKMS